MCDEFNHKQKTANGVRISDCSSDVCSSDLSRNDTLLHEETFGPIATFLPYDSEEELLELMNDTPFGLSASLWTNDLGKALRMVPAIEAGTVWVNMHTLLDPAVPFGGSKSSGQIGRAHV